MTANCRWIQALVMRIQNEFLENPALNLTLPQAQQRFGVDGITCGAVLGALLEASVLAKTPEGTYVRFFPRYAERPDWANAPAYPQETRRTRVRRHSPGEEHAA